MIYDSLQPADELEAESAYFREGALIAERDALEAENAWLKAALEQIMEGAAASAGRCMNCDAISQIAATALEVCGGATSGT